MTKILFICHGNICRSPMAEFVMRDLVRQAGLEEEILVDSAAATDEEIGRPVYPPAAKELMRHGLSCAGKTARRMRREDYDRYDLLIGMDGENLSDMKCCFRKTEKLRLLMDYTDCCRDVADPWYTGDFSQTYADVLEGCSGLLKQLTGKKGRRLR